VSEGLYSGVSTNAQRATVLVGIRQELYARHQCMDGVLWPGIAGHRQRTMGHAMVATREADDVAAPSDGFRQLERRFYCIGARGPAELQAIDDCKTPSCISVGYSCTTDRHKAIRWQPIPVLSLSRRR
jgi:hypothetical protein